MVTSHGPVEALRFVHGKGIPGKKKGLWGPTGVVVGDDP